MEEDKGRRSSGSNGNGNGAKRQRTDASRRPHSQPDRLLSVSRRSSSGEPKELGKEEVTKNRGGDEGDKGVRVFKRREGRGSAGTASEGEAKKAVSALEAKPKITTVTPAKSNAANEKWVPKIRIKKSEETVKIELKKRRQRMIVEGSDDDEPEQELHAKHAESPSPSNARKEAVAPPATEGLRKSSRVVKRRTFDDEIDFDEPVRATPRKRKAQDTSEKVAAKQTDAWADEQESADEEMPRKKQKKVSIHEFQKEKAASKPRVEAPVESTTPREKPLTARQRAMQAKEAAAQEQPCTSGREEAPSPDGSIESKERTAPLTARQRSLLACKDGESTPGLIEFPDGLATTDRRRRPKLTEEEKLAKKAEAASKRKQQVEKAAKEIQASAIQKILNQDSSRKKREEKLQKQKQELAEEKKAAEMEVAANAVRWVMGPSGTTVSWPQGTELPSLFSGPISYPPPREKCAACENAYKYRDSRSNLPLCSLECYKVIQQRAEAGIVH